jgi:integrase
MATFRKRPHGRIEAQIRIKGLPQQTKTFSTKEEAQLWALETELALRRGAVLLAVDRPDITVHDALIEYERKITPRKRGAVQEAYTIRVLQRDPIAKKQLVAVRSADVAQFRDRLLERYAAATTAKFMALLSSLYRESIIEFGFEGLVNPCTNVRWPKVHNERTTRLLPEDEERLMEFVPERFRPAIKFAVETGIRRGELSLLRWEWVHADAVRLPGSVTKNHKIRTIPLSSKARASLDGLDSKEGRVFPVCPETLSRTIKAAADKAGLVDVTFHTLRHEATSRFFELGLSMMEVASITGHGSMKMLQRYTHLAAAGLARKLG